MLRGWIAAGAWAVKEFWLFRVLDNFDSSQRHLALAACDSLFIARAGHKNW